MTMGRPSSTLRLTPEQVLRLRLNGQALSRPLAGGSDPAARVARQVCGLQAQDIFAASLGVRSRTTAAKLADVVRARADERTVVWTWLMRGTMHLVAAEDLDWLLPLVGPVLVAAGRTRRRELGLDDDACAQGMRVIRKEIASRGPLVRTDLTRALKSAGLPAGYSPERHLLYRAALEGLVCMGPDQGAKPTYVLLEDWLGRPLKPVTSRRALALLAERHLAAFGPAEPADLAAWSGMPAGMVREAWEAAGPRLVEVSVDGRTAWLPRARLAELDTADPRATEALLLPAFDTYLLGYRGRDHVIDSKYASRLNGGGGMIRGIILVNGKAAGVWKPNRKGRSVAVSLDRFRKLPSEVERSIQAEIEDIERFVGGSASHA